MIAPSVPLRRFIQCTRRKFKTEALKAKRMILEEYKREVDEDKTQDKEENIDPRWGQIKATING
jgi:hypothetical protein